MHQATPQQQQEDLEQTLRQRLGSSAEYATDSEVEVSVSPL